MLFVGIASGDEYQLDEDVIIADGTSGLPRTSWAHGAVKNVVDIEYDFNTALAKDKFARRQIWTATRSADVFGKQLGIRLSLRGVKTDNNGQALMDEFARLFMQRWGIAPWFLRCSICYLRHTLEILDSVRVTHPFIPNPLSGQMGLTRERFEVLEATTQFMAEGRVDLLLLWTGGIERSVIPDTTGAIGLIPGLSVIDGGDVVVPLTGCVTMTTAAATKQIRVGIKRNGWKQWHCHWRQNDMFFSKEHGNQCFPTQHDLWANSTYNAKHRYHLEYKTSAAADQVGTNNDPTTGYVPLRIAASGTISVTNGSNDAHFSVAPDMLAGETIKTAGGKFYTISSKVSETQYSLTTVASATESGAAWWRSHGVRGNNSEYANQNCTSNLAGAATPPQDLWSHTFDSLTQVLQAPNTFNVKLCWDSVTHAGEQCGSIAACRNECAIEFIETISGGSDASFTKDFLESLT